MPPTYQWRREDYNRAAKLEEFLPWFKDWKFDWLDVPGLIRNCPHAYEYPLVDRDPIPQWTFGRVTLMGDAAHPMYPIGSNGASQAILDARVLDPRDPGAWPDQRRAARPMRPNAVPRRRISSCSTAATGPEQVMQLVEERAPNGYDVVTDVLSLQGTGRHRRQLQARRRLPGRGPQRQAADRADRERIVRSLRAKRSNPTRPREWIASAFAR